MPNIIGRAAATLTTTAALLLSAGPARAQLTFTDEALFRSWAANEVTQDFENASLVGQSVVSWSFGSGTATIQGATGVYGGCCGYAGTPIGSYGYHAWPDTDPYVTLTHAVSAFGFYHDDQELGVTIRIFRGALLDQYTLTAGPNLGFWGVKYATDVITRVELDQHESDGVLYDNLIIGAETSTVPEPVSLLFIGTGVFGVGMARLRRRARGRE